MSGNSFFNKVDCRRQAEAIRRPLGVDEVQRRSEALNQQLLGQSALWKPPLKWVAVYDAQPFEISLEATVRALESQGIGCVFPRVRKHTKVLEFSRPAETGWVRGVLGIREPHPQSPICPIEDIDVFLVPGVAFSRQGQRLGRGQGYYDATLANRKPSAWLVGITFDCTVFPQVPTEAHDVSVDWLATETSCVRTPQ